MEGRPPGRPIIQSNKSRATEHVPPRRILLALRLLKTAVVLALPLLGIAIACALVSRFLLFSAAARISARWAIGVLLPFGPLFFRLNYPAEARRSVYFRYGTIICFAAYLAIGRSSSMSRLGYYKPKMFKPHRPQPSEPVGYALEKRPATPPPAPTLEQRRAANAQEFERLKKWAEALRLRKRDLLHSDVEGNREYVVDLALYNQALAKATAERNTLDATKQ